MLVILNRFHAENPKFYSKILIQLNSALILVDILWLVIIMPYWGAQSNAKNIYWDSLSGIHTFALVLAFLELFLKGGLIALVFLDYKKNYPNDISNLFKLTYDGNQTNLSISIKTII